MPGRDLAQDEATRRSTLENACVIAVVGRSADPETVSHSVGKYLMDAGYTVYSVNPTLSEIDGQIVYHELAAIPEAIDIVDVFRGAPHVPSVVVAAIAAGAKTVWVQKDIINDEAREAALSAGLDYVQDMCIRVEHRRFFRSTDSQR